MPVGLIMSVAALIALVPAALLPLRSDHRRDPTFWILLAVALAGPLGVVYVLFASGWRTGLSSALWLTIAVSLVIYAGLAARARAAWRLVPLLLPYLLLFGIVATIWQNQPERPLADAELTAWTQLHIGFAVIAYGLLTIGAVAGLSVFLQERALKTKRPTTLTHMLPSVAEGEDLQSSLLMASAIVLGCGLVSGMASQYLVDGSLFAFAHKAVLSLIALAVIIVLLIADRRTGVRGRRAARIVLLAYLLLTLAYPGVKFVTDVVLA
jgi:ABC-type uncharacterized transport system permease subunit